MRDRRMVEEQLVWGETEWRGEETGLRRRKGGRLLTMQGEGREWNI